MFGRPLNSRRILAICEFPVGIKAIWFLKAICRLMSICEFLKELKVICDLRKGVLAI